MGGPGSMEPIPETLEAVREIESSTGVGGLLRGLSSVADQAREIVPDLVGVSISRLEDDLTFTLVAAELDIALLDAMLHLADSSREQRWVADREPLDEEAWRVLGLDVGAGPVRSTLTLPVLAATGGAIGSVNLYAASAQAFTGLQDEVAAVFGACAVGAVVNADLSFSTRTEAAHAPRRLRDQATVARAVGIIAAEHAVPTAVAEERLRVAAAHAGVDVTELARRIVDG